jgi:ATP-dependent Clp protease ATP-binding subunit ClpA
MAANPTPKGHLEVLAAQPDEPEAEPRHRFGAPGGGKPAPAMPPPPGPLFGRFTTAARQAVFHSRYVAGTPAIAPEHVLLGAIRAATGLSRRIFETASMTFDGTQAELASSGVVVGQPEQRAHVPFSGHAVAVFRAAGEEADRLGHQQIGVVHLLLGLLREPWPARQAVLEQKGIRLDSVRQAAAGAAADELT